MSPAAIQMRDERLLWLAAGQFAMEEIGRERERERKRSVEVGSSPCSCNTGRISHVTRS